MSVQVEILRKCIIPKLIFMNGFALISHIYECLMGGCVLRNDYLLDSYLEK